MFEVDINKVLTGESNPLFLSLLFSISTNIFSSWVLRERREKLRVYYRNQDGYTYVIIQNNSSKEISRAPFVDDFPLFHIKNESTLQIDQNTECRLHCNEKGVYLDYLNAKSSAMFKINYTPDNLTISNQHRGYRGLIEPKKMHKTSIFWPFQVLYELIYRLLLRFISWVLPVIIILVPFSTNIFTDTIGLISYLVIIGIWAFSAISLYKGPKKLWQFRKYLKD